MQVENSNLLNDASTQHTQFLLGQNSNDTSESDNNKDSSEEKSVANKKISKKKVLRVTPFGEADKHDSHMFYVDIVYVVLHMIGKRDFHSFAKKKFLLTHLFPTTKVVMFQKMQKQHVGNLLNI